MRICLISDKYPPDRGGLAISAQRLARGLLRAGHQVHVCITSSANPPGSLRTNADDDIMITQVGAHESSEDTLADWLSAVHHLHEREPFDLLHGYYAVQAGFIAAYAGRLLGVPSVVSVRGNDLDRMIFKPEKASHILWALANASAVTAVTSDLAQAARALAPGQTVQVIFNSVDADLFAPAQPDPALLAEWSPDGLPLIGFVGEARLKKGLGVLLPACAQAAAQQPARLLLIGGVRKDAKDLLRVFRHQFPAFPVTEIPYADLSALPALYNTLDLLVLPSLRDGMPNALLEGMACGRAVVASRVGGMTDVVTHGENGWLVPPGDGSALADALVHSLSQPAVRAAWGAHARAHMLAQFQPEREIAANLALYARLLAHRSS